MKFYDFSTNWDFLKTNTPGFTPDDFYKYIITNMVLKFGLEEIERNRVLNVGYKQLICEQMWHKLKRPYYNIYPGIVPHLAKLKHEKIPTSCIKFPLSTILFRFAESDHYLDFPGGCVKTILVHQQFDQELVMWIDFGEVEKGIPILTYKILRLTEQTVEAAINVLKNDELTMNIGVPIPNETLTNCIRIVVGACLLSTDSADQIIDPDVLSKDRSRFAQTRDNKFVDKAHRRGKVGWNIGQHLEVSPHWRGPSPLALYWVGKGRQQPLYRYRKGTLVKRTKIKDLPTGYLDDNPPTDV